MSGGRVKLLGVDYGERRIGLAIAEGSLAEPLAIVDVRNRKGALEKIAQICRQEEISQIVIGLPRDPEGNLTIEDRKIVDLARELRKLLGCPVVFGDETLTSQEAVRKMVEVGKPRRKRRRLDDVAAALILQEYLDHQES
jgi:putative Holliday junction resolvase